MLLCWRHVTSTMGFKSVVRYKSFLAPAVSGCTKAPLHQFNWWIIPSLKGLYFILVYNYVVEDVVELSELNYLRSLCWILSVNPFISLSPWSSISHPALNLCSPAQPQARHYESWAILTLYFRLQVPALPRPSSSAHPLLIHLSLNTFFSVPVSLRHWLLSFLLSCCLPIEKNLHGCWGLPAVVPLLSCPLSICSLSFHVTCLCLLSLHLHYLSFTHCYCIINIQIWERRGSFLFMITFN